VVVVVFLAVLQAIKHTRLSKVQLKYFTLKFVFIVMFLKIKYKTLKSPQNYEFNFQIHFYFSIIEKITHSHSLFSPSKR
jgi:hypothetical protein